MIEINHLTKRYGDFTAVNDISFSTAPGQVLGFLGPNGAGKSTTMKMITGFLAPTSGSVRVSGYDVQENPLAAKAAMGYLPEGAPAYGEMTVQGFMTFIADVRQLTGAARQRRLNDVTERLALGDVLAQPIDTLSKGYKRRVGLAQALLHDPKVLILDEPTDGLDPNQKHEVRTLINDMAADKIIVISTHILEEVAAVCNRAIIIARGRLLADDTPQALGSRSRYHNAVTLRFENNATLADVRRQVAALNEVASVESSDKELTLTAFPKPGNVVLPAVSALAAREVWPLKELHLESGRLDEVFRTITTAARGSAQEVNHA